MLGDHDQMQKGGRFIWYYWTQALHAHWSEYDDYYQFRGAIKAFRQLHANIVHTRTVKKYKAQYKWEVTDEVDHHTSLDVYQLWHPARMEGLSINFAAFDKDDKPLQIKSTTGWHSPQYGIKEEVEKFVFSTGTNQIRTIIEVIPNKVR